jgi:hypothetical protein
VWDKRKEKLGMHKKFDSLWLEPYQIEKKSILNPFIWPHLREGDYRYMLMDPFSSPIMLKEHDFLGLE